MTISKILTIEQVAELLNVRPSWLYQRTCDGSERGTGRGRRRSRQSEPRPHPVEVIERIPHFKAGRLLRFDRDEVLAWFTKMHRNGYKPSVNQPEGSLQDVETQDPVEAR
jgi:predicted DNA-binding transcriptional regulator AlpA